MLHVSCLQVGCSVLSAALETHTLQSSHLIWRRPTTVVVVVGGGRCLTSDLSLTLCFLFNTVNFLLYLRLQTLQGLLNSEPFKRSQQGRGRGESLPLSFCFSPSLVQIMTNQEEGDMAEAFGLALHQGILSPPAENLRAAGGAKLKFQEPLPEQESVWLIVQACSQC